MTVRTGESTAACKPSQKSWVRAAHILACNGVDDIVRGCSEKFGDDGELIDMIFAGKERLPLQHLGEDTPSAPNVHLDVVFLPGKHDLRSSVVPGRDIAGHLRILYARQTEVTDLQVAVLVHEDVARLQVSVDDARRVDVLQSALHRVRFGICPYPASQKYCTRI